MDDVSRLDYDAEILQNFNNKSEVRVIIVLKDTSHIDVDGTIENKIKKLKEKNVWFSSKSDQILSNFVQDEFRPVGKLSTGFSGFITRKGFDKLIKNPMVESIHISLPVYATLEKSVSLINVNPITWNLGYIGNGSRVCIIDTGIDNQHTAFTGKIINQTCFCSVPEDSFSSNCCANNQVSNNNATDNNGHGTHVAGVISSQDFVYRGVAYGANLYVAKALNSNGEGIEDDIGRSIDWCNSQKVDIISISIGDTKNHPTSSTCPNRIDNQIDNSYNQGIFIIAAAGNENYTNGLNYPACSPNVISVGSSTKLDKFSTKFSNRHTSLDLLAPGGTEPNSFSCPMDYRICSTWLDNRFLAISGTSMATPHVSASAAILKQFGREKLNLNLTPTDILNALNTSGVPITDTISGLTFNRIDVAAAINYLSKINVGDSVKGEIKQNQTWQTNLSVINIPILKVTLKWKTQDNLKLILISPNNTLQSIFNRQYIESLEIPNPSDGVWTIKVVGNSVAKEAEFDIQTESIPLPPVDVGRSSGSPLGGINFTSTELAFVSACNSNKDLQFIIKAKEAGPGDQVINITENTEEIVKIFKTALTIPDHKIWVSLPIGGVDVDSTFAKTGLAKEMLENDVNLKLGYINGEPSMMQDIYDYYFNTLGGNTIDGWWFRTAIIPGNVVVNATNCEVFVVDSSLDAETELMTVSTDSSDVITKDWKDYFSNKLHNQRLPAIKSAINNNEEFKKLREVIYPTVAIAQWYKKQDWSQVPYGEIINRENITGLEADTPFDPNYWNSQSQQFLYNIPGYSEAYVYGGIVFDIETNISGVINNETKNLMENATKTSYVKINDTYYYGTSFELTKPDLKPIALGFSSLKQDVNATINISVVIENSGKENVSSPFKIKYSYALTYPNGYIGKYLIGEKQVDSLGIDDINVASILTNLSFVGNNNITVEIDYENNVEESNEINNQISESIQVVDPKPISIIDSPHNGNQYQLYEQISFFGSAIDNKDSELNEALFNWTSNKDGYLGNGSILDKNLSVGDHVIYFTVQDSDGNKNTDQIIISVLSSQLPNVNLKSPLNNQAFKEGESIYLIGEAIDNEDGQLTESSLIWNSSLDGVIGIGEVVSINTLSVGVHNISLTAEDSGQGRVIKQVKITIEESSPNITINLPINNQEFFYNQNNINFNGSVVDPHEGNINEKLNWTSSLDGYIGFGSNFTKVLSTGTHLISAFVRDGFGLTGLTQIYLTILESQSPKVSINTPNNNQEIINRQNITFRGSANDPETGNLVNNSLIWTSSLDSNIGNGTQFSLINLTVGNHNITLTAKDQDNLTSTSKINLIVKSVAPSLTIISPSSGNAFKQETSILFNGSASDYEDGILNGNSLKWYSGITQIGTGTNFSLSSLDTGTHNIMLNSTDSHGMSNTQIITISVVSLGNNTLNIFSDGSSNKDLNLGTGNQVVYVRIPRGANITSAALTIEGIQSE